MRPYNTSFTSHLIIQGEVGEFPKIDGKEEIERPLTDHGRLLYHGVVGLLQIAVQDVTKHTGGILMQVASSFRHTVVLAPDGDVDALFLLMKDKKS